jgi:hypothetical protein
VISVGRISGYDHLGYASIVGTAANPVWIGVTSGSQQSADHIVIQVQASSTLYIANAEVNGSAQHSSTAIDVAAGGGLVLGGDKAGAVTGTVTIGNQDEDYEQLGYEGIVCGTGKNLGCTITDVPLVGMSSVVIEGQEGIDIDAEDYAVINLTSSPVIGVPPMKPGFHECPAKTDAQDDGEAVLMNNTASVTLHNGTVQCIAGDAFLLETTASGNGTPTLNLDATTIQNTNLALYASAGTATLTNSTIQYNVSGVEQALSGKNTATIDLSGAGADGGTNTIICSNSTECAGFEPCQTGVSVLNATTQNLNASNVTWDTSGPDLFKCNGALASCTCEIASCTDSPGANGMDAVYISSGTITTTGNQLSAADCTP